MSIYIVFGLDGFRDRGCLFLNLGFYGGIQRMVVNQSS